MTVSFYYFTKSFKDYFTNNFHLSMVNYKLFLKGSDSGGGDKGERGRRIQMVTKGRLVVVSETIETMTYIFKTTKALFKYLQV